MSTDRLTLARPPEDESAEQWLRRVAGKISFEDVAGYAKSKIGPTAPAEARALAEKAIEDALYGLMMVADGVSGALCNELEEVLGRLSVVHQTVDDDLDSPSEFTRMDAAHGAGMCIGFEGWRAEDFGAHSIVDVGE
ncbi:MAG: hypothetical protein ACJAYU_000615 [Bradymonadia bacterium]|jgi:hypothetical protein